MAHHNALNPDEGTELRHALERASAEFQAAAAFLMLCRLVQCVDSIYDGQTKVIYVG